MAGSMTSCVGRDPRPSSIVAACTDTVTFPRLGSTPERREARMCGYPGIAIKNAMLRPMPRYAAFLRGVSPMNAKMPQLKAAFEAAGFTDVTTVLSSGNVVFNANRASEASLQHKAEVAMTKRLD